MIYKQIQELMLNIFLLFGIEALPLVELARPRKQLTPFNRLAATHQMALLPTMRKATYPSDFETGLKVIAFFQLFLKVI